MSTIDIGNLVDNFKTVDRLSVDNFINAALNVNADVSTIMSTILGKFKNTDDAMDTDATFDTDDAMDTDATFDTDMFRSVICKKDDAQKIKIRGYDAFLTQDQYDALKKHDDDLKRQYATLKNSAEENYLFINDKYATLKKSNDTLFAQNAELEKVDEYLKAEYAKLDALKKIPKLWRITHTLFSLCESIQQNGSGDCSLAKILEFYDKYKNTNAKMNALNKEELAEALNHLKDAEMSGGNQKGGDMAQIATLLAGIDAAVSKISSLTESAYKTLCELCKKAADFISSFPLSKCLQIIMGDILYASMKNVIDVGIDIQPGLVEIAAKGATGVLAPYAVYSNRMALLNGLSSMVSYLPQAGGLFVATVTGVIVFNTSMQAIEKAPSAAEISISLNEYISTLTNLDATSVGNEFKKLWEIIKRHLAEADKATVEQNKQALDEFSTNFNEMMAAAIKITEEEQTLQNAQDRMTIRIRKAIFENLLVTFEKECEDITEPGCLERADQLIALGVAINVDDIPVKVNNIREKVDAGQQLLLQQTEQQKQVRLKEEKKRLDEINRIISTRMNQDETARAAALAAAVAANERKQLNKQEALKNYNATDVLGNKKLKINEEEMKNGGKSSARKTHKKHPRKTTRKPRKKPHKKSRKHRRSRKH